MTYAHVRIADNDPQPIRDWHVISVDGERHTVPAANPNGEQRPPEREVLFGYRGHTIMDAGYFFVPYVPLTTTPTVLDPRSFDPQRGILTRYGRRLLEEGGQFYNRVTIDELEVRDRTDIVERLERRNLINPRHLKYDPKQGF
jgi:hypothetical protein